MTAGTAALGRLRRLTAAGLAVALTLPAAIFAGALSGAQGAVAAGPVLAGMNAGKLARVGDYMDGFTTVASTANRRVVVLNAWDWPQIPAIKAGDPGALVLVYKDLASTRNYSGAVDNGADAALLPTGVGYMYAQNNHPEWFLTDAAGKRMEWQGYPRYWSMDTGNPAYQLTWLANVGSELSGHGWDGVWVDDALTHAGAYHPVGVVSPKYPTDASMQTATRSMLSLVAPALRRAGKVIMANIADARLFPGLWHDWLGLLDGALEENFVKWDAAPGAGYEWDWGSDGWIAQVNEITDAEAQGKFVVIASASAATDAQAMRYVVGSWLLGNGGHSSFIFGATTTWYPEWGWDLGASTGAYRTVAAHTYQRDFTAGSVVVNAGNSASVTVALGGTYLDESGTQVQSVTLGPTSAAILRLVSQPPPPPPGGGGGGGGGGSGGGGGVGGGGVGGGSVGGGGPVRPIASVLETSPRLPLGRIYHFGMTWAQLSRSYAISAAPTGQTWAWRYY